jgi:two-component system response regulator AtoC
MRDILIRPADLQIREFHGIYTVAAEMEALFRLVTRVARADCTVLVRGETGSGKELVARAIHKLSARRKGPFQAVNCATFSPTLLESELFGHVRGAFTGAVGDRPGLFQLADKGTLLLDEVSEIPLDIQARLLRVLQERTFVPVGGTKAVTVDVRVISASNKALRREVAAGRFRDDLRYRIRVVPIFLPPLRDRGGDVEALFWHFVGLYNEQGLRHVDAVTRAAMTALQGYSWPGNVRELRNVIEHAFVVGEGPVIDLNDFTPELRGEPPPRERPGDATLHQGERERLVAALQKHNGSKGAAAAELGMSRSTLWRKMREHHL